MEGGIRMNSFLISARVCQSACWFRLCFGGLERLTPWPESIAVTMAAEAPQKASETSFGLLIKHASYQGEACRRKAAPLLWFLSGACVTQDGFVGGTQAWKRRGRAASPCILAFIYGSGDLFSLGKRMPCWAFAFIYGNRAVLLPKKCQGISK